MTPDLRKVIIRGHIFNYEEKAPFVVSGVSVLGALEYDDVADKLKCHECGAWWDHLGAHLFSHSISAKDYKLRHGLNQATGLVNRRISESVKTMMTARLASGEKTPLMTQPGIGKSERAKKSHRTAMANHPRRNEGRNINAKCRAQILFRIQVVAAQVGHTPSRTDMQKAGLAQSTICWSFGTTKLADVMLLAGLTPNQPGCKPSKLDERMPWPDEYFRGVTESIALAQRSQA